MLRIPDINRLILLLVAHHHCHNIRNRRYYLSLAISTRPTNGLFTSAERLLLGHPFKQLTSHVIDLDGDVSWLVQGEEMVVWVLRAVTRRRENPWLVGQWIWFQIGRIQCLNLIHFTQVYNPMDKTAAEIVYWSGCRCTTHGFPEASDAMKD